MKKNEKKKHIDVIIKDGIRYISVTVILGIIRIKSLEWWRGDVGNVEADRLMKLGGSKGTEGHSYFQSISKGESLKNVTKKMTPEMKKVVSNFHEWDFSNVDKHILSEQTFYSKKYHFMGDPDLYVKLINGSLVLIDHKTGKVITKKDKWQACAYKYLLEENGHKVNDVIILHNCIHTGKLKPILIPRKKHLQYFHSFLYTKKVYIDWHYN